MPNKLIPPKTTTATRTSATPIDGELFYDTDEKSLYTGDGVTQGGLKLSKEWNITDTKTANYTANNLDWIPCDTSGGTFDITTPATGDRFVVYDLIGDSSTTGFGAASVFVVANTGTTVHGTTDIELDRGAKSYEFRKFGTNWRVVNGY